MSFGVDPCYCEQAIAYEKLLEKIVDGFIEKQVSLPLALLKEITGTLDDYKRAQEDYVSQDDY